MRNFLKTKSIFFNSFRFASTNRIEGLREKLNEEQCRICFDQWINSLWFAPGGWTQSTKHDKITVNRRYLPFWNLSLSGSVDSSVDFAYQISGRKGKHSVLNQRWHTSRVPIEKISLTNLNIYAAQTVDRYHLNQLNISFDVKSTVDLNQQIHSVEQWTVDKETTFHIGWDLQIVPQIKNISVQEAKRLYPGYNDYRVKSFHFTIDSRKERLLYYPIYIINYEYGSNSNFTCLVDGITGKVTGDRQYSMTKITLATFFGFYPMALTLLLSLGSLVDPSVGVALASSLTFRNSIPIAFIVSPIVGFLAKNYPKYYRDRISQQQWQNYRSNFSQFTYDFTETYEKQYRSYQQRFRKESSSKSKTEDQNIDLYKLLSIDRTATEKEIKRAYLVKVKELHPDRNPGDKKAEELFKKVNQAYTILSDKYKREQYDKYGYESVKYSLFFFCFLFHFFTLFE